MSPPISVPFFEKALVHKEHSKLSSFQVAPIPKEQENLKPEAATFAI